MNQQIERVMDRSGRETLAVFIYGWRIEPGIKFLTEPNDPLQVGCMHRPQGYLVTPHVHKILPRVAHRTSEVLFLKTGRIRVDIFDPEMDDTGSYMLLSRELRTGDIVILFAGGHGIEILEGATLWEIKQGPFLGDGDKMRVDTTCST